MTYGVMKYNLKTGQTLDSTDTTIRNSMLNLELNGCLAPGMVDELVGKIGHPLQLFLEQLGYSKERNVLFGRAMYSIYIVVLYIHPYDKLISGTFSELSLSGKPGVTTSYDMSFHTTQAETNFLRILPTWEVKSVDEIRDFYRNFWERA